MEVYRQGPASHQIILLVTSRALALSNSSLQIPSLGNSSKDSQAILVLQSQATTRQFFFRKHQAGQGVVGCQEQTLSCRRTSEFLGLSTYCKTSNQAIFGVLAAKVGDLYLKLRTLDVEGLWPRNRVNGLASARSILSYSEARSRSIS